MSIATYDDYNARMYQLYSLYVSKNIATNVNGMLWSSTWATAGAPATGVTPTTAVATDNTTTGAMNKESIVGATDYQHVAVQGNLSSSLNYLNPLLIDRLSHQGGLSATVTTTQTTNLPTAALTRYTDGVGVMAALEIYSAIGTTQTTVTVSYTNQDGTSGRTSQVQLFGGTGYREAAKMIVIMPQDGDYGIRSVESVTLAGSTVSAAGNFGVTLFKPLLFTHPVAVGLENYGSNTFNSLIGGAVQFNEIEEGACLSLCGTASAAGVLTGTFDFMEIS